MDIDSRLRVARGIGKTETEASVEVFEILKSRGHPDAPPPLVSDGWGGIREAMVEVYGKVPPYSGRGRPPAKKEAQPGWRYLQVVKIRDSKGHVLDTELRPIFGELEELGKCLGKSTSYVERTHLTIRTFSSRNTRKSIAFSKELDMYKASAALEDAYYNWMRPVKTLRLKIENDPKRKWIQRTPAMAANLTDHIWTFKELFYKVPINNNT